MGGSWFLSFAVLLQVFGDDLAQTGFAVGIDAPSCKFYKKAAIGFEPCSPHLILPKRFDSGITALGAMA